jgi:hypothetical protein
MEPADTVRQSCAETHETGIRKCGWVNLAVSRPVNASSDQEPPTSSHAVDGIAETSWTPQNTGVQLGSPYWLAIDLGVPRHLCRMVIRRKDVKTSLRVEGSIDGTTWQLLEVLNDFGGFNGGFEFAQGSSARWVRIVSDEYTPIDDVEIYELLKDRRLQDPAVHQQCIDGMQSTTACCEACLQCTSVSCVVNMPNCSNFLAGAYTDCTERDVDMNCCKAIWWLGASIGFLMASCSCWCFCRYSQKKRKRQQQLENIEAQKECSKFTL